MLERIFNWVLFIGAIGVGMMTLATIGMCGFAGGGHGCAIFMVVSSLITFSSTIITIRAAKQDNRKKKCVLYAVSILMILNLYLLYLYEEAGYYFTNVNEIQRSTGGFENSTPMFIN